LTGFVVALGKLVELLGPGLALTALFGLVAVGVGLKIYTGRRLEKAFQLALDEKERTVQRLADECRQYRVLFGIEHLGLNQQRSEKIFQRNDFATPEEARKTLEGARGNKKPKKKAK